jgi:hypothetical protein
MTNISRLVDEQISLFNTNTLYITKKHSSFMDDCTTIQLTNYYKFISYEWIQTNPHWVRVVTYGPFSEYMYNPQGRSVQTLAVMALIPDDSIYYVII